MLPRRCRCCRSDSIRPRRYFSSREQQPIQHSPSVVFLPSRTPSNPLQDGRSKGGPLFASGVLIILFPYWLYPAGQSHPARLCRCPRSGHTADCRSFQNKGREQRLRQSKFFSSVEILLNGSKQFFLQFIQFL